MEPALRCSFCDKTRREVKYLIVGLHATICNECVGCCVEILDAEGYKIPNVDKG